MNRDPDTLADTIDFGVEMSLIDERIISLQTTIASSVYEKLIDTEEQCIRDGLIRLGWTPPSKSESGQALPQALRALAARLTPNPARTIDGTLAVILDGIDRLDNEQLARSLACVNARQAGLGAEPLTDEQWKAGGINEKLMLIRAAAALKEALRIMPQAEERAVAAAPCA